MERAYETYLGTALVAVGLALLLFGFYQAYSFIQNPPTGQYFFLTFTGAIAGSLNGRFVEASTFLLVEYLVGASILKAGWNVVTPKAETIQVRVKPRSLQLEPVAQESPSPSTAPSAPSPSPGSGFSYRDPSRAAVNAAPWSEDGLPPAT